MKNTKKEIERIEKAHKDYVNKIASINEDTDKRWKSKRTKLWKEEGINICRELQGIPELKAELKGFKAGQKQLLDKFEKVIKKCIGYSDYKPNMIMLDKKEILDKLKELRKCQD